jgi:hypothetical protein
MNPIGSLRNAVYFRWKMNPYTPPDTNTPLNPQKSRQLQPNTEIVTDEKTIKKIMSLRKSMEQIVIFTLVGCIIPILWPFMLAFGPLYALQRRSILRLPEVDQWFAENADINMKEMAKYPTVEGGLARIKISGTHPWIPVVLPIIALIAMIGLSYMI